MFKWKYFISTFIYIEYLDHCDTVGCLFENERIRNPRWRTQQTTRQNERFVPQLKFTCRRLGIVVVGTLPVRDRPHWYLMSIRSVVSNSTVPTSNTVRHGSDRTRHLSRLPHEHVISIRIQTFTPARTHARVWGWGSIAFSRISSIANLTIVTCSSPSPIPSIQAPVATN